jgi:CHASE2 domain-containing sensor protein
LLAVAIFILSWLRFPNFLGGCVDYLERPYLALADSAVPDVAGRLRVIHIERFPETEMERLAWRPRHAKLLRALASAGARAVAFDIAFNQPSPFDADLVEAVRAAGNTRVVFGYEPLPGQRGPRVSPTLRPSLTADQMASLEVGEISTSGASDLLRRHVLLANVTLLDGGGHQIEPAFPLQVLLAAQRGPGAEPGTVVLNASSRRLELRPARTAADVIPCRITEERVGGSPPVLHASVLLRRVAEQQLARISMSYAAVEAMSETTPDALTETFKDTIVLVGADVEDDQKSAAGDRKPYGHDIHASVVSMLLQAAVPRELGLVAHVGLLFALGLVTGGCRLAFPRGDRPLKIKIWGSQLNVPITLIALVAAYVAVAVRLFTNELVVLDPIYDTAAIVGSYYVTGWFWGAPGLDSSTAAPAEASGQTAPSAQREGS